MGFFKSEGYEGLGAYAEPLDRRAGQNERFAQMLAFARDRKLITKQGRIYQLHPELIGLDYLKLRAQIVPRDAHAFLQDFVARHG